MYFLTYLSHAKSEVGAMEVKDIVEAARKANFQHGITGMLVFRSRTFFQLLEGNKKNVLAIFQKIARDERHENIEVLFEIEIEGAQRIFPSWQMGLVREPLEAPDQEALVESLQSIVLSERPSKEKILDLLQRFSAKIASSSAENPPSSAREILARAANQAKGG
jgi:hypothetical protein